MEKNIKTILNLFRGYDENHIVLKAPLKYRQAYYEVLKELTKDVETLDGYQIYFEDLKSLFQISNEISLNNEETIRLLTKKYKHRKPGFFNLFKKPDYTHMYIYPLLVEAAYILAIYNPLDSGTWITDVTEKFKIGEPIAEFFNLYFDCLFSGNYENLLTQLEKYEPYIKDAVFPIAKHIVTMLKHDTLPVINVSIISTMSAGKSTFINALIGNEVFPESQAACTAKITSIYDNDSFMRIAGVAIAGGKLEAKNTVRNQILKNWNDDKQIDQIILEGDLNNISSRSKIIAIHDTPGINFSGDKNHRKITINFLQKTKMDIMLCVLNAEYIATTDALDVMKELKKIIDKHKQTKLLFILNKIDVFDSEKESIGTAFNNIKIFIERAGFKNSPIIPASIKAARLFKMALENRYMNFTDDEIDTFRKMLRIFSKGPIVEPVGVDVPTMIKDKYCPEESIVIEDKQYNLMDINKALYNSGFPVIEHIINNFGGKND